MSRGLQLFIVALAAAFASPTPARVQLAFWS